MDNDLQFYCLNLRGAGNKTKRQSIFHGSNQREMPSYFYKNVKVTLLLKKFGAKNGVVRFFLA